MREALAHIGDRFVDADWWYYNADSIALAVFVTIVTAVVWPPVHEASKYITQWIVTRLRR